MRLDELLTGGQGSEWDQHRHDQRERRAKRLPIRTQQILDLRKQGYTVEQKTEYHFRVNGRIDLWPIHNRYHDILTGMRGGAANLATWVTEHIERKT